MKTFDRSLLYILQGGQKVYDFDPVSNVSQSFRTATVSLKSKANLLSADDDEFPRFGTVQSTQV